MSATKGKWEVSKISNFTGTLVVWVSENGKRIFTIREQEENTPEKEFETYVRLIAAAPALLTACKEGEKRIKFLLDKIIAAESFPDKVILERIEIDKSFSCMSYILQAIAEAKGKD